MFKTTDNSLKRLISPKGKNDSPRTQFTFPLSTKSELPQGHHPSSSPKKEKTGKKIEKVERISFHSPTQAQDEDGSNQFVPLAIPLDKHKSPSALSANETFNRIFSAKHANSEKVNLPSSRRALAQTTSVGDMKAKKLREPFLSNGSMRSPTATTANKSRPVKVNNLVSEGTQTGTVDKVKSPPRSNKNKENPQRGKLSSAKKSKGKKRSNDPFGSPQDLKGWSKHTDGEGGDDEFDNAHTLSPKLNRDEEEEKAEDGSNAQRLPDSQKKKGRSKQNSSAKKRTASKKGQSAQKEEKQSRRKPSASKTDKSAEKKKLFVEKGDGVEYRPESSTKSSQKSKEYLRSTDEMIRENLQKYNEMIKFHEQMEKNLTEMRHQRSEEIKYWNNFVREANKVRFTSGSPHEHRFAWGADQKRLTERPNFHKESEHGAKSDKLKSPDDRRAEIGLEDFNKLSPKQQEKLMKTSKKKLNKIFNDIETKYQMPKKRRNSKEKKELQELVKKQYKARLKQMKIEKERKMREDQEKEENLRDLAEELKQIQQLNMEEQEMKLMELELKKKEKKKTKKKKSSQVGSNQEVPADASEEGNNQNASKDQQFDDSTSPKQEGYYMGKLDSKSLEKTDKKADQNILGTATGSNESARRYEVNLPDSNRGNTAPPPRGSQPKGQQNHRTTGSDPEGKEDMELLALKLKLERAYLKCAENLVMSVFRAGVKKPFYTIMDKIQTIPSYDEPIPVEQISKDHEDQQSLEELNTMFNNPEKRPGLDKLVAGQKNKQGAAAVSISDKYSDKKSESSHGGGYGYTPGGGYSGYLSSDYKTGSGYKSKYGGGSSHSKKSKKHSNKVDIYSPYGRVNPEYEVQAERVVQPYRNSGEKRSGRLGTSISPKKSSRSPHKYSHSVYSSKSIYSPKNPYFSRENNAFITPSEIIQAKLHEGQNVLSGLETELEERKYEKHQLQEYNKALSKEIHYSGYVISQKKNMKDRYAVEGQHIQNRTEFTVGQRPTMEKQIEKEDFEIQKLKERINRAMDDNAETLEEINKERNAVQELSRECADLRTSILIAQKQKNFLRQELQQAVKVKNRMKQQIETNLQAETAFVGSIGQSAQRGTSGSHFQSRSRMY